MKAEVFLDHLGGVKPSAGGWIALCPAHEDENASLSVAVGDADRILLKCFAGCTPEAIVQAIGLSISDLFEREESASPRHDAPEKIYPYVDEGGEPLFEVVRFHGKRFRQRRQDPTVPGGWVWKLGDVRRLLYRADRLHVADRETTVVYICEGEKDVEALERHGVLATCNPMGAGKWRPEFTTQLSGFRKAVVVADDDGPGRNHARQIAAALAEAGTLAEVVLPRAGKDASDHLDAGHTIEQFQPLPPDPRTSADLVATGLTVDEILAANPGLSKDDLLKENPLLATLLGSKETMAQRLVRLVVDSDATLFHDAEDRGYITFPFEGAFETWPLRSRRAKLFVRHLAHASSRPERNREAENDRPSPAPETPSGQAVADALAQLEALALFDGEEFPTHLRVAGDGQRIHLDLGDAGWRAATINAKGWCIEDHPVRFRRAPGMAPLCEPQAGGTIDELRPYVNVVFEADFILLVSWLVGALRPGYPMPVLVLAGEQGSAKTTTARILRSLIDPSTVPTRAMPRDVRDLMITASAGYVLSLDNVSGLPAHLSDSLCRLSTGGGFATRQLYTDDEEILFQALRPVIVNGIESAAERSDLLDRSLLVSLPTIDPGRRQTESQLLEEFKDARPRILGALLDAVAGALGNLHNVHLETPPRMADFAQWVVAAEPALGWQPGAFLSAYEANRAAAHELAVEASAIGSALIQIAEIGFEGTAGALLELLTDMVGERVAGSKDYPRTPRGLAGLLQRLAPNLRALGVEIDHFRQSGGDRQRTWHIARPR